MNRRGFFKTLAAATVGFAILPPATTYQRVWKAVATPQINPAWISAPAEIGFIFNPMAFRGEWKFITDSVPVGFPLRFTHKNGIYESVSEISIS